MDSRVRFGGASRMRVVYARDTPSRLPSSALVTPWLFHGAGYPLGEFQRQPIGHELRIVG